jgi:L-lactate dehydrogenase complex protein LldG
MSSREQILAAIRQNQPAQEPLPELDSFRHHTAGDPAAFRKVVETLGGQVYEIQSYTEIPQLMQEFYTDPQRVVSIRSEYFPGTATGWQTGDGRQLEQVDLAIVPAQLGVAENGAVWVTEDELEVRVLPFITQHLAIVLQRTDIVPTMHDAYARIGGPSTGFGAFIAGPSKTADIEQSLVLGAHGAKSLTVFLIG